VDPIRRALTTRRRGFTLVELALVVGTIGILAALAISGVGRYRERALKASAIATMRTIATNLSGMLAATGRLPDSLAEIGMNKILDPWGNPYRYTNLATANKGQARKDRFLVPINSDYDLWSMGPDGKSVPPLTAKASRDDIVRANDGTFYGVASDY
jgi:general secretion pathway protein G